MFREANSQLVHCQDKAELEAEKQKDAETWNSDGKTGLKTGILQF
jgi:hypothetical protein